MQSENLKRSALLIAISALLSIVSCGPAEKNVHTDKAAQTASTNSNILPSDIKTALAIELKNISDTKAFGAIYTTDDIVAARARIGGTLVRLNVSDGSEVGAGQAIGTIDEARFGAEIAAGKANAVAAQSAASAAAASARQAPAQMAAAQAMAQKAHADYNRTKILFDQGVYAQAKLDQMRAAMLAADAQIAVANAGIGAANANVDASRAQAQSAAAAVNIARATRGQGQIMAPRSGRVVMVAVTQGSVVMPGEIVATIAVGAPVLRLQVPEADAKFLNLGQKLETQSMIGSPASFATINKIYPMVENGQIKIDLAPDTSMRFIGERVEVKIPIGSRDAILVPKNYIFSRQGVDFVRLLSGSQSLEIPIQRGASQGEAVEVLSGLKIGDKIILPQLQASKLKPIAPAKH